MKAKTGYLDNREISRKNFKRNLTMLSKKAIQEKDIDTQKEIFTYLLNNAIRLMNEDENFDFVIDWYITDTTEKLSKEFPKLSKKQYSFYMSILYYISLIHRYNKFSIERLENYLFKTSSIVSLWLLSEYDKENELYKSNSIDIFLNDKTLQNDATDIFEKIKDYYMYFLGQKYMLEVLSERYNINERLVIQDIKSSVGYNHLKGLYDNFRYNTKIESKKLNEININKAIIYIDKIIHLEDNEKDNIKSQLHKMYEELENKKGYIEYIDVIQEMCSNLKSCSIK